MDKRSLKKLTKSQLIKLLLKQKCLKKPIVVIKPTEIKKPKVDIVDDTVKTSKPVAAEKVSQEKPGWERNPKTNRLVKIGSKTYYKLHPEKKPVREGWERNPRTNRLIKIDGRTYQREFPMQYALNKIDKVKKPLEEETTEIGERYRKVAKEDGEMVISPTIEIKQVDKALKGYAKSFKIDIIDKKNPLVQLQNTRKAIETRIMKLLNEMKGLKFVETLVVRFNKMGGSDMASKLVEIMALAIKKADTNSPQSFIRKTTYFNSKAQTIINNEEVTESLELSKQQILNEISKWVSDGSGWTVESVENHFLNVVKYQPMKGSSYIKLPLELRNSAKGLINMKNEDNECFRWCHIRHLNPQAKHPQRIKKSDKEHINKLNYTEIEFPLTVKQYNKIEKQNYIRINVFG